MLKSTYKPAPEASLPPGWAEHQAPTGHTYYYNAATGESTYKRPTAGPAALPPVRLSDPRVANAFMAQMGEGGGGGVAGRGRGGGVRGRGGRGGGGGGGGGGRPVPQPTDKPKSKVTIPGCEPWLLVYTKYGRRFAYNPEKKTSYWRIPERLKGGILELDKARILGKAGGDKVKVESMAEDEQEIKQDESTTQDEQDEPDGSDDSEYEVIEVTDDEADESPAKRQKTEDREFGEDDIAFQLEAMGEYEWLEEEAEEEAGDEAGDEEAPDARAMFKSLLDDSISPFSPWDKLVEEGKVMDDPRYTALTTMRERKEVWEEWSRERIQAHKERAQERAREKPDPRVAFMALLHEKANPKLYWPEFRRKHRKEAAMRDAALSDKDREKWYREHVARLKLPEAARKADLTALLKGVSREGVPPEVAGDVRFISLPAEIRDALVEAYMASLPVE
ncbi:hypothetical protein RB597_002932 [Gaeumannomyces tritici]